MLIHDHIGLTTYLIVLACIVMVIAFIADWMDPDLDMMSERHETYLLEKTKERIRQENEDMAPRTKV